MPVVYTERGKATCLPLIGLATTIVPELIRLIAGDKAGTLATNVSQAVTELTGTDDPVAARQKLAADAAASATLQQRLAEIALEATRDSRGGGAGAAGRT